MHRLSPSRFSGRFSGLLAGLLLAACAAPVPVAGFRNPARPIYSSAVLDPALLLGSWVQTGDFALQPGCRSAGVSFVQSGAGIRVAGRLCLSGQPVTLNGPLVATGPGRFAVAGISDPLWVLWADADARTLALGTPSGRFGVILDRRAMVSADRLTAARQVLEWNGYDLRALQITR